MPILTERKALPDGAAGLRRGPGLFHIIGVFPARGTRLTISLLSGISLLRKNGPFWLLFFPATERTIPMLFRFSRLAAAAALALPAAALTALLPPGPAQAAAACSASQATVTFADGTFTCQSSNAGNVTYPSSPAVTE